MYSQQRCLKINDRIKNYDYVHNSTQCDTLLRRNEWQI